MSEASTKQIKSKKHLTKKYNNLKLFGIDKSPMGCKLASIGDSDYNSSTNIICGDILKCPINSKKFDIVFSFGLIEHFDNPEKVLEKDVEVDPIGGIFPFLIMESYHPKSQPLSYKIFHFFYRYLFFLPTIIINLPFLFRLNSLFYSPLLI